MSHFPSLYLITPHVDEADTFRPALAEACAAASVAAVLLRLAPADERTLVNRIKALAPTAQEAGAALVVAVAAEFDLPAIAIRGGADGVHATGIADLRDWRDRLKDRILGTGGLRTRDDAMSAGEAGADYLMFGEPKPDGFVPPLEDTAERTEWWAEIFETPCAAYAADIAAIARLAASGAEFVAIGGDTVWSGPREAVARAAHELRAALVTA